MTCRRETSIVDVIVRIAVIAAIAVLCVFWADILNPQTIASFMQRHSIAAPVIFIAICALKPLFVFLPSIGLTIVAGTLFGTFWGTIYVVAGGALSTAVGYYFARWIGRDAAQGAIRRSAFFRDIDEKSRMAPLKTVLYMRTINLPWDAVSYWAGLSAIRFRDFYIASIIPLVPISFLYTYFGSNVFDPASAGFIIPLLIIFLLGAIPYLHGRLRRSSDV